jgi:hypothetical protein
MLKVRCARSDMWSGEQRFTCAASIKGQKLVRSHAKVDTVKRTELHANSWTPCRGVELDGCHRERTFCNDPSFGLGKSEIRMC